MMTLGNKHGNTVTLYWEYQLGLATITQHSQSVTLATAITTLAGSAGRDPAPAPVPAPADGDTAAARRHCAANTQHTTHG
jgi:hypothetical protein